MSYHPSPASIHEAGHALTAYICRRGPVKVELTGEETGKTEAIEYQDPRTRRQIEQDIEISLAGPHAEFLQFGKSAGIDNDITDALAHLRHLNPKAAMKDLQPYIDKVTDILSDPTTWPKIQALAEQLQRKRSLTFNDIDKILSLDYPNATPPHHGAKLKFAPNPDYTPEKITKALAVNRDNREYAVLNLPSLPI